MKIAFFSNYLNVHQLPLCQRLYQATDGAFTFVATERISESRLKFGYPDMDRKYPFVLRAYDGEEEKRQAMQLAAECDVVIHGSAPWYYQQKRLEEKKLTFFYSERLYRSGFPAWKWPVRLWRFYKLYGRYPSLHLLCASAYTAADFAKTFTFRNKAYKWGYFPEAKKYDSVDSLIEAKDPNSILWVARMIPLKHPEYMIEIAKKLKAEGYSFRLRLIGNGELEDSLKEEVQKNDLSDCVEMLGAMKPEQVREHMEKSELFLFTSNKQEGWGAVLNESMNSACAVVASHAIGSVPFLIQEEENGLVYQDGNVDDLYNKVKYLLDHSAERKRLAKNAYRTITDEWNAENAANKLLQLIDNLHTKSATAFPFANGVCSKAEILKDNWKK